MKFPDVSATADVKILVVLVSWFSTFSVVDMSVCVGAEKFWTGGLSLSKRGQLIICSSSVYQHKWKNSVVCVGFSSRFRKFKTQVRDGTPAAISVKWV